MGRVDEMPAYVHCGSEGMTSPSDVRTYRVSTDFDGSQWVEMVDRNGKFIGFDPTAEQIKLALFGSRRLDQADWSHLELVTANTRRIHDEMIRVATAEVTGVGDMGVTSGRFPFRRVDKDGKAIGKLIYFGGVDKDGLQQLNTTELTN